MIQRLLIGREPFVCLDFGRDQLSAVEIADGAVTRWLSQPLSEDALRNGDPILPAYLGQQVGRALTRAGIQARRARMALPDEATVSRQLVVPPMGRRDLVLAMHFLAEKHIPFPVARARWAWDVVERTSDRMTVYLVATWRDVVERYVEVARVAGLVPEVLEPRSVTIARALEQEQALLLDGGGRRFHVTLVVGGQPAFVEGVVTKPGAADRREALDRLLQRAYRHQSTTAAGAGRLAPVLLAGDLEASEMELPLAGRPVGEVLNGQLPPAPRGFRPGSYLANIGLSMRPRR